MKRKKKLARHNKELVRKNKRLSSENSVFMIGIKEHKTAIHKDIVIINTLQVEIDGLKDQIVKLHTELNLLKTKPCI